LCSQGETEMSVSINLPQIRVVWWLPGFLLLMLLSLSACQPVQAPAASAIPAFTIEVSDDAVSVPEVVPGGIVRVTIKNNGSIPMDIGLARVLEGSTPEEVIALARGGEEAIIPLLTKASFLPSFNPIAPGAESWAYIDLRTGVFVVDATGHVEGTPVRWARPISTPSSSPMRLSAQLSLSPTLPWRWRTSLTPCPTKSRPGHSSGNSPTAVGSGT
jgi:hypothetical protein